MPTRAEKAAESRVRILDAAAALFRTQGFTATGVDELMSQAGLTAGAFYAHFDSKQDLLDETLTHMLKGSVERLTKGVQLTDRKKAAREILERYVSEQHRDHPELGCAIPSIASEIGRHSKRGKEIIGGHIDRWAKLFESGGMEREEALRIVSQAVGAVLLARLVPGSLSKEILRAASKEG